MRLRPPARGRDPDPAGDSANSRGNCCQSTIKIGAPACCPQAGGHDMTPTATKPAARRGARQGTTSSGKEHGRAARPSAPPRRVSGPSGGRTAAARTASPPKRRPQAKRTAQRPAVVSGLVAFARALPDHRVIDRLIRGRAWIPVLGVMLAGIVAMQVEVLKLGATMGRAIEQGSALQSRNELLRDSVASLQ